MSWSTHYEPVPPKGRKTPPGKAVATYSFGDGSPPFVFEGKVEADDTSELETFVERAHAALEEHRRKRAQAKLVEERLDDLLNAGTPPAA